MVGDEWDGFCSVACCLFLLEDLSLRNRSAPALANVLGCGDFARFVDSTSQCLRDASWLIMGYCRRRVPCRLNIPRGRASSGWDALTWSMLARDTLRSLGGGMGRLRVELTERRETSFSNGGGGRIESGEATVHDSGSLGRSGITIWAADLFQQLP
jgi:hypothetical protein